MSYDGTLKFDTHIDTSGFQSGLGKLADLASGAMKTVTAIIGAGATAITGFGVSAVNAGREFDYTMSGVASISGATGEAFDDLRNKAIEMGEKTKFSATDSAEAFSYMAMAGWEAGDMLSGIEGIMNLAAASGEDLATTSDIVTDALTAFGLTAADSSHFADIMAAASSNANTNVSMLGESFKYVAPVAGAMSYSAEDVALALGLMANSGIKASQAGTALRTVLGNMAKPTKEMQTAMDTLGISLEDESGEMLSLRDIMDQLRASYAEGNLSMEEYNAKLTELNTALADGSMTEEDHAAALANLNAAMYGVEGAQRAELAAMLAGKEGMSGLLAIISASPEDYNKLAEAIDHSSDSIDGFNGVAERMSSIAEDNLEGDIHSLESAFGTLQIRVSDELTPSLRDFAQIGTTSIREVTAALAEGGFEGMVEKVGEVLSQLAMKAAETAPVLIDAAVRLVDSFIQSVLDNSEQFAAAGVELVTSLITAVISMTGEMGAAAVTLFTQFLAGMAERIPEIVETGKASILQFVQSLVDNAPSLLESASTIISTLIQGVAELLPELLPLGFQLIGALFEGLMNALPQIAASGVEILGQLAASIAENLPALIPVAMQALVDFTASLRENFGLIVDAGLSLIMALADALIQGLPVFIETIPEIIINICGLINDNAPKLIAAGLELIVQLALGLIKAIPVLIANIPKIIQAIVAVFTAFNWLNLGKSIIEAIKSGIQALKSALPDALKNIGNTAKSAFQNIDWKGLGKTVINAISSAIKGLAHLIPNTLKSIGTAALNVFKNINWAQLGQFLVKGIAAGISAAKDALFQAIKNLCTGLLNSVKDFFGIHSPSSVMADEVGEWLPPGIGKGVKKAMPKLLNASKEQMRELADTMQTTVRMETGKISVQKTGQQEYEQAVSERRRQQEVTVSGKVESSRPLEIHVHSHVGTKEMAEEIAPAVNHELYKINSRENNRGRGN